MNLSLQLVFSKVLASSPVLLPTKAVATEKLQRGELHQRGASSQYSHSPRAPARLPEVLGVQQPARDAGGGGGCEQWG